MKAAEELFDIFDRLNVPYYRQGSAPEKLPERFYTFWEIDSDREGAFDNKERFTVSRFGIWYYDNNIRRLYSEPDNIVRELESAGWKIEGLPIDHVSENGLYCRHFRTLRIKEDIQ